MSVITDLVISNQNIKCNVCGNKSHIDGLKSEAWRCKKCKITQIYHKPEEYKVKPIDKNTEKA